MSSPVTETREGHPDWLSNAPSNTPGWEPSPRSALPHKRCRSARRDAFSVLEGEAKAGGRSIVKNVNCEAAQSQALGKRVDEISDLCKTDSAWDIAPAEAWQVRGHYVKAVRKQGDQVAEHVAGRWKAMKQEERWRAWRTSLAIEYSRPIHMHGLIRD